MGATAPLSTFIALFLFIKMKILDSLILFRTVPPITQIYNAVERGGKTLLLYPVSEEQYLAIQLHPDKILPPHIPQQDFPIIRG